MLYWKNGEYVGLGRGASPTWTARPLNHDRLLAYLSPFEPAIAHRESEMLLGKEARGEERCWVRRHRKRLMEEPSAGDIPEGLLLKPAAPLA